MRARVSNGSSRSPEKPARSEFGQRKERGAERATSSKDFKDFTNGSSESKTVAGGLTYSANGPTSTAHRYNGIVSGSISIPNWFNRPA
ncbi:hypothetical protein MHYP_G00058800 [Metynnis hypsauchen]